MRKASITRRFTELWQRLAVGDDAQLVSSGNEAGRSPASIRLRHLIIALAASLVVGVSTLLDPLDQLIWGLQVRMVEKEPSGEIGFVGLGPESSALHTPEARRNLARVLDRLRESKPELIALDVTIVGRTTRQADAELRDAIARFGDRIVLVERLVEEPNGSLGFQRTDPFIRGTARQAPDKRYFNYLNFAWRAYSLLPVGDVSKLTLPVILAGNVRPETVTFSIDYRYNTTLIASMETEGILNGQALLSSVDKVVVGHLSNADADHASIPGRSRTPASFVTILAAETLRSGVPYQAPFWLSPLVLFFMFLSAVSFEANTRRAVAYVMVAGVSVASIFAASLLNFRTAFSAAICLAVLYALTRILLRFRHRTRRFDESTGLETFRALENSLEPTDAEASHLIVAKVANFDEVLSALPGEYHQSYLRLLANRLRIADDQRALFFGGNGYFAWVVPAMGRQQLIDHLTGIRQLCYEPVQINEVAVDLKVTFGVNASSDSSAARKIASARQAASRSHEADDPIVFVTYTEDEQRLWGLSIQHKIDQAIEAGHIFPMFQPQFSAATGEITGVEALVRWIDPARGAVPTEWFIEQCEQAGRMGRLTRLMLVESARQLMEADATGTLRLSVNISAVSLHDEGLYRLIEDALQTTGFSPDRLTLELTETWRVANPDRAARLMATIGRLGVKWALDDFGVKTATYDALLLYPLAELKIDRSLISRALDPHRGRQIVRSICDLGKDVGMNVVAEGVQSEAEFAMLQSFGCSTVQGFALSPPLVAADLRSLLSAEAATQQM